MFGDNKTKSDRIKGMMDSKKKLPSKHGSGILRKYAVEKALEGMKKK